MKAGIRTVLLALSVMGFSAATVAAPAAEKIPSEKSLIEKVLPADKQEASGVEDEKVSINTATADELARVLNGVGIKKAQAIVSHREEFGPFKSVDELRQVPGIGGALIERNQAHLTL